MKRRTKILLGVIGGYVLTELVFTFGQADVLSQVNSEEFSKFEKCSQNKAHSTRVIKLAKIIRKHFEGSE